MLLLWIPSFLILYFWKENYSLGLQWHANPPWSRSFTTLPLLLRGRIVVSILGASERPQTRLWPCNLNLCFPCAIDVKTRGRNLCPVVKKKPVGNVRSCHHQLPPKGIKNEIWYNVFNMVDQMVIFRYSYCTVRYESFSVEQNLSSYILNRLP